MGGLNGMAGILPFKLRLATDPSWSRVLRGLACDSSQVAMAVELSDSNQYVLASAYLFLAESSSPPTRHGEKKADIKWWSRASFVSDDSQDFCLRKHHSRSFCSSEKHLFVSR